MKTTWLVKVFNRSEKEYDILAMCEDCLSRIIDEYGYPLYTIVKELNEPVECQNEFCEHRKERYGRQDQHPV